MKRPKVVMQQGQRLRAAALGLVLWAVVTGPATAERAEPRVGYFQTADGAVGFVFDRSGEQPKQRFDHSPEILILKSVPAARGDTVYRLPDGRLILRMTPFGGLTLFPPNERKGLAVVRVGDAAPLQSAPRSTEQIERLLRTVNGRLTWVHGVTIQAEAPTQGLASDSELGVLGDAIENLTLALDEILLNEAQASDFTRLVRRITFELAERPGLTLEAGLLKVYFAPRLGVEGRPASAEIRAFIARAYSDVETFEAVPDDDGAPATGGSQPEGASSNP